MVMSARKASLAVASAAAVLALGPAPASAAPRVWAVGDGGVPEATDDRAAARVQQEGIDRLLYLGDVYETGTAAEFRHWYDPGWGRFKAITKPTPGNHEWSNRAQGYDPYWGGLAPRPDGGRYYSFDIDGWHFVSLNSHESASEGSRQAAWLRRDLRALSGTCTVAYIHRPRYSAGGHGDATDLEPLYRRLVGRSVALLSGHEHNYQRLRPNRGVTQLIVGTGGRRLSSLNTVDGRLAAWQSSSFGALRLELQARRADLVFVRTDGSRFDAGLLGCRPHRPVVSVSRLRNGAVLRRVRSFQGRTRLARRPVRVSILRRRGWSCRTFDGRAFRRSSCRRSRISVRAGGLKRWHYRLKRVRRLPPGRYRLTVSADGAGGNRTARAVRFRIR
jgi:acid phosphatase type 7